MRAFYTWGGIFAITLTATTGDVLVSRAMKQVGEVGHLWRRGGWRAVVKPVLLNGSLWLGVAFMALSFFSLLFSLSWADVSLVGPASASLTFVSNAMAAHLFLHEKVDHRRWLSALLVAGGVVLVAG